jgi:hypothetical protein
MDPLNNNAHSGPCKDGSQFTRRDTDRGGKCGVTPQKGISSSVISYV